MKRVNWIFTAVIAAASVFLLALWYYLGFNLVDNPLDLALTFIWWAIVLLGCYGIHRSEKRRRERVRTAFLGQGVLFNPEAGYVNTTSSPTQVEALQGVLENLDYSFDLKELSNSKALALDYVVRTSKFEAQDEGDRHPMWEGEVSFVHDPEREPVPFRSKTELASILGYAA